VARRALWILAGVMTLTIASVVPFAIAMRGLLTAQLDGSQVAENVANGVNGDWWQEFLSSQGAGIGSTFSPRIVGFAATLDSLSAVADTRAETAPIAALLLVYVLLWTYLSAGIIDRYARRRPTRAQGFAAACGRHALPFLGAGNRRGHLVRVGVRLSPSLAARHRLCQADAGPRQRTRRVRVARRGYAIVGVLVRGANVILDYAKIRIVVEDRRSAIGGLIAAVRFLPGIPATAGGLYLLNTVTCAALLAAWAAIAPSAGAPAGLGMWLALALGQGFIVARLATKLHFVASQTALFQRRLAHERFTSAPVYRWPDAAHVETPGSRCIRRTRAIYVYLAVYLAPDGARSMTSGRSRSVSVPMASKPEGKRLALRTYAVRSTYSTRDSEPGAGSGMDRTIRAPGRRRCGRSSVAENGSPASAGTSDTESPSSPEPWHCSQ
jgi:hypothetical protein